MDQSEKQELYRRIDRLEAELAALKQALYRPPSGSPQPPPQPQSPPPPPPPPLPPHPTSPSAGSAAPPRSFAPVRQSREWQLPPHMRTGEFWLKIIGIGLTLFGVAFAFKYSIDQGWINPPVRHVFGLAVGTILLVFGFRLYHRRRAFAQVLLGGSIGTFYITCFSAFQLFHLISHPIAFTGMVMISIGSFTIAIKQDQALFSLIGTAGALGTPFLLYTGSGNVPGLVLYTSLVLTTVAAIYFIKSWRLLLWFSMIGGWIVFILGIESMGSDEGMAFERWSMQAGLTTTWLIFWLTPLARRVASIKAPEKWKQGLLGIGDSSLGPQAREILDRHVHLLSLNQAMVALLLSAVTWPGVAKHTIGWATMGAVVIYALVAFYLKKFEPLKNLSFTQAAVGTLLFTIGLMLLLENQTLQFVIAAEALTLHVIARRISDRKTAFGGHILFAIIGTYVFLRVATDLAESPAFFNWPSLTDLWTITCLTAAAFVWNKPTARRVYLIAASILLGLLFHRELDGNLLFFLLTVETTAAFVLAQRLKDEAYTVFSHFAWIVLAILLGDRLFVTRTANLAYFNVDAALSLLPLLLAAGASTRLTNKHEKLIYLLIVHIGLLAWLARELLPFENGQGYVSVVWGIYGAILLIAGLRRNIHAVRLVGLGTLMLVVAKLFLVDLARLETIWRVLLFVGFGGVFLALSYYFPKLWKKAPEQQ